MFFLQKPSQSWQKKFEHNHFYLKLTFYSFLNEIGQKLNSHVNILLVGEHTPLGSLHTVPHDESQQSLSSMQNPEKSEMQSSGSEIIQFLNDFIQINYFCVTLPGVGSHTPLHWQIVPQADLQQSLS